MKPSLINLRMFWRELAIEISFISFGSSHTFLAPHLRTLAANRFCDLRDTMLLIWSQFDKTKKAKTTSVRKVKQIRNRIQTKRSKVTTTKNKPQTTQEKTTPKSTNAKIKIKKQPGKKIRRAVKWFLVKQ